jgi:hypothetical protein
MSAITQLQDAVKLGVDPQPQNPPAGKLSGHRVATLVMLSVSTVLAATAAAVAALFAAYIVTIVCAALCVTLIISTIIASRIDLSQSLDDLLSQAAKKIKEFFEIDKNTDDKPDLENVKNLKEQYKISMERVKNLETQLELNKRNEALEIKKVGESSKNSLNLTDIQSEYEKLLKEKEEKIDELNTNWKLAQKEIISLKEQLNKKKKEVKDAQELQKNRPKSKNQSFSKQDNEVLDLGKKIVDLETKEKELKEKISQLEADLDSATVKCAEYHENWTKSFNEAIRLQEKYESQTGNTQNPEKTESKDISADSKEVEQLKKEKASLQKLLIAYTTGETKNLMVSGQLTAILIKIKENITNKLIFDEKGKAKTPSIKTLYDSLATLTGDKKKPYKGIGNEHKNVLMQQLTQEILEPVNNMLSQLKIGTIDFSSSANLNKMENKN